MSQEAATKSQVTPKHITEVGLSFMSSKVLLSAIKFELFTLLAKEGAMSAEEIRKKLDLHDRGLYDFMDTLVALGFLNREGIKENAVYSNTAETDQFLDKNKPSYIGGIMEMFNARLYKYWDDLEEGLQTGKPQNEIKHTGKDVFEAIYEEPDSLRRFLNAMSGFQKGNFHALAQKFDFSSYSTLLDLGGADGTLATIVAEHNPGIEITTADFPKVTEIAREKISNSEYSDRINAISLDFFEDSIPKADIITLGNVLHDWGVDNKKQILKNVYDVLPKGGATLVIENIIDNERKMNVPGLLMSLNMLIETESGFDFTMNDFDAWAKDIGFQSSEQLPLGGPASAAIAYK